MNRKTTLHGIAFDLDDTVCPRTPAFQTWVDAECRRAPEGAVDRVRLAELDANGYGPREPLLAYLGEALGWRERDHAARYERFVKGVVAALEPDPALLQLLSRLARQHRLAVITNGRTHHQRAKLAKLGLTPHFDPIVISEEAGVKKPAPAIFAHVIAAWGCAAGDVLFVGDDPQRDVLGARASGLREVWLSHGRSWPLTDPAPPAIESIFDLEPHLTKHYSGESAQSER